MKVFMAQEPAEPAAVHWWNIDGRDQAVASNICSRAYEAITILSHKQPSGSSDSAYTDEKRNLRVRAAIKDSSFCDGDNWEGSALEVLT